MMNDRPSGVLRESSPTAPSRSRPTIRTVAERAGVSKSLVSLVMRGSSSVSEARREAVLQAAQELGYRPNAMARSLVEGRTRLVGALVADLHNPFFVEFLDGLQEELHGAGLRLLLGSGRWDPAFAEETVEAFLELRVDGLVLLSTVPAATTLIDAARAVPIVIVGERDAAVTGTDVVADDGELGARLAVDHLVEFGHRRIAHVHGEPSAGAAAYRRAGYEAAMRRHGLTGQIHVAAGDFTEEGGYRATRALLATSPRPTAIFAPNDLAALGALTAADESGLRVPTELSIVGYDNTSLAAIGRVSLTSVDQPRRDMGRIAADRLSARMADPAKPTECSLVVPHLVARGSSGPAHEE